MSSFGFSRVLASIAIVVLFVPATASAQGVDYTAGRKVGRGLAALTTGFLEIPGNIVQVGRQRGYDWGFTWGFAMGVGKIIPRTLVGTWEFLTAPFELPAGYKPIMQPEFPWDYFDEPVRR